MMMGMLVRSIQSKPAEQWSDEDRLIIQTYNQKVDFVNLEALDTVAEAMQQLC